MSSVVKNVSLTDFDKQCDEYKEMCKKNGADGYVMTDYVGYNIQMKNLRELDEKRANQGLIPFAVLQMEINLMSKILLDTKPVLLDPQRYGVAKYEDYQ